MKEALDRMRTLCYMLRGFSSSHMGTVNDLSLLRVPISFSRSTPVNSQCVHAILMLGLRGPAVSPWEVVEKRREL